MNKIEIIESIGESFELLKVVENILAKSGYSVQGVSENTLVAEIDMPVIGRQRQVFFVTTDKLSRGYDSYSDIVNVILRQTESDKYNAVFLVSSKYISEGFKEQLAKDIPGFSIAFWDRSDVMLKINESYDEYWRHTDQALLKYEQQFQSQINDEWGINKVKQFRAANLRLLEIFIEPRLLRKVHDKESTKKAVERIKFATLSDFKRPITVTGEAGSGKTKLLKQIGCNYLKENVGKKDRHFLPIFIDNVDLIESRDVKTNQIDIRKAIQNALRGNFEMMTLEELSEKYQIVLTIDSIDEFDKENQANICADLLVIHKLGAQVILGTRYQDSTLIGGIAHLGKIEEIIIERFNDHQIRLFLEHYFNSNVSKASSLIESLKENNIIQRLPITPLTLSLISILYEENNFEVPATLTDIYDNFSNMLLGRALPDSRFDFFDVNFRERILSVYGLELLQRKERSYMTLTEFYDFFEKFFKPISGTVRLELLPQALDFLVTNTGILTLQEGKYVRFHHESYLEYYASREIFFFRKEEFEPKLVENFLELDWQYSAIFYAGRTKEMSGFLKKIIEKTKNSRKVNDFYKSITGLGYLIQALYMTDDELRKEAILQSLSCSIEVFEWMKKLSADEIVFFRGLSMPVTALISCFIFFEYNNSTTIGRPLELAYDELRKKLEYKDEHGNLKIDHNVAFKLFSIALTLTSPRINNMSKITDLVENTSLLNDKFFELLIELGVTIAGSKELYLLKENLKREKIFEKQFLVPGKGVGEVLATVPVGRFRFSARDKITPNREVLLLTEGKTDVQIIEHAYIVLTGEIPYWEVEPISVESGGANKLAKCLANSSKVIGNHKIVIGIFDNDAKGIQEFNGELRSADFDFISNSKRIKKHKTTEIYGMKLPIPPFRDKYCQDKQSFNFFSIEHYFDDDFLEAHDMISPTAIEGVFEIRDNRKDNFSKEIRKINDPEVFKNFYYLFTEIDMVAGRQDVINYLF